MYAIGTLMCMCYLYPYIIQMQYYEIFAHVVYFIEMIQTFMTTCSYTDIILKSPRTVVPTPQRCGVSTNVSQYVFPSRDMNISAIIMCGVMNEPGSIIQGFCLDIRDMTKHLLSADKKWVFNPPVSDYFF